MIVNLQKACGLPVAFDVDTCELILGEGLNRPSYRIRKLHDLDAVWANPVEDGDRVIYRYTSGLWLDGDAPAWAAANIISDGMSESRCAENSWPSTGRYVMVGRSENLRFVSPMNMSFVPAPDSKIPLSPKLLSYSYWVNTELTVKNTGTSW